MNLLLGFLGATLASMLDPLVIAAGLASYFIGRRANTTIATALAVVVFAFALFILVAVLADQEQRRIGWDRLLTLLSATAAWAAASWAVARAVAPPQHTNDTAASVAAPSMTPVEKWAFAIVAAFSMVGLLSQIGPLAPGGGNPMVEDEGPSRAPIGPGYLTGDLADTPSGASPDFPVAAKPVPESAGRGVEQTRTAADQGDAHAQFLMGIYYARGIGVPQDRVQAHMYFAIAARTYPASQTDSRRTAIESRDYVAASMTPEQIAEAQARAQVWQPK